MRPKITSLADALVYKDAPELGPSVIMWAVVMEEYCVDNAFTAVLQDRREQCLLKLENTLGAAVDMARSRELIEEDGLLAFLDGLAPWDYHMLAQQAYAKGYIFKLIPRFTVGTGCHATGLVCADGSVFKRENGVERELMF